MDLPWHLRDLEFDHDAAFRASWAVDELVTRINNAADHRARVASDILCRNHGPFARHLERQVAAAGTDAADVVAELRRLQARIDEARDEALAEDLRRRMGRAEWEADQAFARSIEARAQRALGGLGSPGPANPAVPARPN